MAKRRIVLTTEQRKERAREYNQRYYAANKEKLLAKMREARLADPEFHQARDKAYYAKHLDVKKARVREYKSTRKEHYRELHRQWEKRNPERKKEIARQSYARRRDKEIARVVEWTRQNRDKQTAARVRRRGLINGATGEITDQHIAMQKERQRLRCYYCLETPEKWEVDHFIPLKRGGSNGPENIVMTCMPCNRSKSWKLPWEWRPDKFTENCKP